MWYTFWLQNAHFVLEVVVALAAFTTAWLYVDSWGNKREAKTMVRALGFFAIALWSLLGATSSDVVVVTTVEQIAKYLGLLLLLLSFILDPLPTLPEESVADRGEGATTDGISLRADRSDASGENKGAASSGMMMALLPTTGVLGFVVQGEVIAALILAVITVMVYRRATTGLIREWMPMGHAFLLFTLSEIVATTYYWGSSTNIIAARWFGEYGPLWFIENGLKGLAFLILGRWAWGYIRFRVVPQLFVLTVSSAFAIFVLTAVAFSTILLQNVQRDQLEQMDVSLRTVEFAVAQLGERAELASKIATESAVVREAILVGNVNTLFSVTNRLMLENETDFFTTVNGSGDVVMRADDRTRVGDNLSDDAVVANALGSETTTALALEPGLTTPAVVIRSASPILTEGGAVAGASSTGFRLDTAFVDGVKEVTGLDVTVFSADQRSATTLLSEDGASRELGVSETDASVLAAVLERGDRYADTVDILNVPFYAAYAPVKDTTGEVVGMLQIARPQLAILDATNRTIQLTLVISAVLMLLSLVPAYGIARYIAKYQRA